MIRTCKIVGNHSQHNTIIYEIISHQEAPIWRGSMVGLLDVARQITELRDRQREIACTVAHKGADRIQGEDRVVARNGTAGHS
jgi:hypothetical protein